MDVQQYGPVTEMPNMGQSFLGGILTKYFLIVGSSTLLLNRIKRLDVCW